MRSFLLACFVLFVPGWANTALAQQPRRGIAYGWGEKIVHVGDLPPEVRAELRKETNNDLAIGFCYQHSWLFGDGFDFWTWHGKYVLFEGNKLIELTDEQFVQLLGKERFDSLDKPLTYRFPVGLLTALGIVVAIGARIYLSAQSRARRLLKDNRYQQALEVYAKSLPSNSEPNRQDIENALAGGVEFLLQTHGIPARKAGPHLRLLVSELERERSYELRNQGVEHEQAGEWEQAIGYYEQAACVRENWDKADYEFLLKCIQRVRDKQARSKTA
jgi:tetratricopeptide (TPR) repeat protein